MCSKQFPAGEDVITFDKQVGQDGTITLRTACHARGESDGGLSYDAVVARLCVEFTAAPGPPPVADVRDTDCAANLPRATGNVGNVDVPSPSRADAPAGIRHIQGVVGRMDSQER